MMETQQEARPDVQVVTNENVGEYVDKMMGNPDPEARAAEEHAKQEEEIAAKKAAEVEAAGDPAKEFIDTEETTPAEPEVKKSKKDKLNERFSELTAERKAAEEKAAKAEERAAALQKERDEADAERRSLKEKYEPVKTEQDPEPLPSQFTDLDEYRQAIKDWTADNTRREDAKAAEAKQQKEAQQRTAQEWSKRVETMKAETPDYAEVIAASPVVVSDQIREAIVESEVGAKILYHLAKNPEVAEEIAKLTVGKALKAFGRLEAKFLDAAGEKPQATTTTVAQISQAPAPISPIKGGNPAPITLRGSDEFHGSFEEYKKKRMAGKIH